MSDNVLHLGISIPINYMIGSYPVMTLYSGQTQIWSAKSPIAFTKAEGSWVLDMGAFTSNEINGGESTIEKVYFKNLGGKTITITYDFEASPYDANFYIFTLDSETEILTTENDGTAYGECGRTGSVDLTFPDDGEHFICLKYSKWDECEPWGRDNVIVTFPPELFGEAKWIVVGEVIRYEYENNALYKCVYQDLQLSFNGALTNTHKDGELISKEPTPTTIISPDDTIKLDDVSYGFWVPVPEVDPNKVYNLSFNSPTSIVFGNPIKISSWNITNKDGLEEIRGLNFVDTSNVTNMSAMFHGCSSLRQLDLSGWDVSNVTNMSHMFYMCSSLRQLDLSGWDTSKVTNMGYMFSECFLNSLNVSNLNTSNVTNMSLMFRRCTGTSLDLSGWDTSKVTDMSWMFQWSEYLTSLNLSGWDVSNVTNMSCMFDMCYALTTIIGPIAGISTNISISSSPLTHDSAMVFMNGLSTVTETRSIDFGESTYNTLTEAEIAAATAKGWTVKSAPAVVPEG